MTVLFRFVDKVIWPDKPRAIATRYGLALALPLASVVITHSLFPLDRSPFSPLLVFSVVCVAMFGGIQAGVVGTVTSLLLNVLALRPTVSLQFPSPKTWFTDSSSSSLEYSSQWSQGQPENSIGKWRLSGGDSK